MTDQASLPGTSLFFVTDRPGRNLNAVECEGDSFFGSCLTLATLALFVLDELLNLDVATDKMVVCKELGENSVVLAILAQNEVIGSIV